MLRQGCEQRCPACSHREFSAQESEALKSHWLSKALAPWKDLVEPIRAVEGDARWNYRDKTLLHAEWRGGRWLFGMRVAESRQHARRGEFELVEIPGCPVHSERVRRLLFFLSTALPPASELPLVFISVAGRMFSLVLKTSPKELDQLPALKVALDRISDDLKKLGNEGVFLNFNASAGDRVFSSRGWKKVLGEDNSEGYLGLRYGPQSFQQLIPGLYEDALNEASQWISPSSDRMVVDLYSGLGASIHRWKRARADSVGVELLGEAVRLSGLTENETIFRGKVSERIPQIRKRVENWRAENLRSGNRKGSVVVFANPPRTGLENEVIEWISTSEIKPEKIAYLSCSAGTLARDLSKLEALKLANPDNSKYRVRRIIPYDFFPQTHHVETLACLELDSV